MPQRDVIVIGGSAGALGPLKTIVQHLPVGFGASLLVVLHTRSSGNGALPQILSHISKLPVRFARRDEPLRHGHIYIAPPDLHLIVAADELRLVHGPRENGFRPAIDPLFRTAARELQARVAGIILSGALSDGTYGLSLIKQHGGVAIVQDPAEADVASMPNNALAAVDVDYVLPAMEIAAKITELTEARPSTLHPGETPMPRREDDLEPQLPTVTEVSEMEDRFGAASSLTCPDCGGALWEVQDGRVHRYQCHTGHQFAPDALDAEQRDAVDGALWSAMRVLEEHAELKMRLARRAADNGLQAVSEGFLEGAQDARAQAQQIRSLLFTPSATVAAHDTAVRRNVPHPVRAVGGHERRRKKARKKIRD